MDITKQKDALLDFLFMLPSRVEKTLNERSIDVIMRIHDIGGTNGLVVKEIWWLYEGIRQVLAGEGSPSELVAFLEKENRIEEDNRPKIASIAYEIQTKIFDTVLPILKEAGFTVKEGRVAPVPVAQPMGPIGQIGPIEPVGQIGQPRTAAPFGKRDAAPSSVPPFKKGDGVRAPLDEKHLRALLRIAAGTDYTETQLREAFEDLPPGLRQAITSVDTANTVQNIAKKYLLHIDQMAALASETGLVLLGFTHPRDFVKNLASRLRLQEPQALQIAREISGQILGKVREALRGLHEEVRARLPTTPPANQRTGNYQLPTIQEPPRKLEALAKQAEGKPQPFRSETPYSPDAKWNLGLSQDLKKDAAALNKERVGPTGWKPSETPYQYTNPPRQTNQRIDTNRKTEEKPAPAVPPNPLAEVKKRPSTEPVLPPPPPPPKPEDDFLAQKLAGPIAGERQTRRYSLDPYRELLE